MPPMQLRPRLHQRGMVPVEQPVEVPRPAPANEQSRIGVQRTKERSDRSQRVAAGMAALDSEIADRPSPHRLPRSI